MIKKESFNFFFNAMLTNAFRLVFQLDVTSCQNTDQDGQTGTV